jgi:hypothetical protein
VVAGIGKVNVAEAFEDLKMSHLRVVLMQSLIMLEDVSRLDQGVVH